MRKLSLLLVVCSLFVIGCGGQEVETASGGTATGSAASPNENAPRTEGGQAVVNDPSQIKNMDTSQGVVVKPANPDDPKFKMDPKLGGGN